MYHEQKKTMLIIDRHRLESPLQSQFYRYLEANSPFRIIFDDRVDTDVWTIINDRLQGKPPDYVYFGFVVRKKVKSHRFLNKLKTRVIFDVDDVDWLLREGGKIQRILNLNVNYLVLHWPKLWWHKPTRQLKRAQKKYGCIQDAEIIHVPWGIDPRLYTFNEKHRNIDVALMCNMRNPARHGQRRTALEQLKRLPPEIKTFCDHVYGDAYKDILNRTKIFIVESYNKTVMVQKYLEGPACGAMLLGDVPRPAKHIFIDGVSIAKVNDFSNINDKIKYYLDNSDERIAIAMEAQKRIFNHYTLDITTKEFIEALQ